MLMETVNGKIQGGAVELPVDYNTGLMRPGFSDTDGNLYLAGLYGWGTRRKEVGGFYRTRYTGKPILVPNGLHVSRQGIDVSFLHELDPTTAEDPKNYQVRRWNYKWLSRYGSDLWKLNGEQGTEEMRVTSVKLLPGNKSVRIQVDDLKTVMQMKTNFQIRTKQGEQIHTEILHSIHDIPDQPGKPFLVQYE